jgi:hypothetical protein
MATGHTQRRFQKTHDPKFGIFVLHSFFTPITLFSYPTIEQRSGKSSAWRRTIIRTRDA